MGGAFAIDLLLVNLASNTCSFMPPSPWTLLSLWAVAVVGALAAFPLLLLYQVWALKHGLRAWSVLSTGEGEVSSPAWRQGWWWLLISFVVFFVGVIVNNWIQQLFS
jgi:hypothetical protein